MNQLQIQHKNIQPSNQVTYYDVPEIKYTPLSRQDFDSNVINNWAEMKISKPPIRRTNQISFFYRDFLYIYGGRDINEGKMSDMYRVLLDDNWDNKKWEKVEFYGVSPGKIAHHKSSLIDDILYVFGGDSQEEHITNNLYQFHIEDLKWFKQTCNEKDVIPLSSHSMSLYDKSLVIFGGFSKGVFNNIIFIYNTENRKWSHYPIDSQGNEEEEVIYPVPEARIDHSQTTIENSVYIYGGLNSKNIYLKDLWKFDLINYTWMKIHVVGEIPKGRKGHSAVLYEGNLFFFGGKTGNIFEINQFWKFDIQKEKFFLIHDTMLERSFEDEANKKHNQTNQTGSKFFDKKSMNTTTSKKGGFNEINRMSKTANTGFRFLQSKQKNFEEIALGSPKAKAMKSSLIYKMDADDQAFIKQLSSVNKIHSTDKIRYKILPIPRDGHSAFINDNRMYVFGGDRNKYPFNDLFMFQLK